MIDGDGHFAPTADGVRLHVEIDGPNDARVTVIFVHGCTLRVESWIEQRAALDGRNDVQRVFYDGRSFGRSEQGIGAVSIGGLAEDLAAVIDEFAPEGAIVLAGHSMGVMVIMALAAAHPELFGARVRGTVLVAGPAGSLRDSTFGLPKVVAALARTRVPGLLGVLGRVPLLQRMIGRPPYLAIARIFMCDPSASRQTLRRCADMVSANSFAVLGEYARTMFDYDETPAVPVLAGLPTVVVSGDNDKYIPAEMTALLAKEIPGATLVVAPRCGHMVPLERPEVVDAALDEVIAAVLAGAGP